MRERAHVIKEVFSLTLASWITLTRFLLVPFIYWQLIDGSVRGIVIAVVLLLLAAITDVLDGWVARARNEISELGKTRIQLPINWLLFLHY